MTYFDRQTTRQLSARGIEIVGRVAIPDDNGIFATGNTAYRIVDNGTAKIWTWQEVKANAKTVSA